MNNQDQIKIWQDRIRLFSILYFFAEDEVDENQNTVKVFHTEVKLQKLDFMVRNPDYLSYFLLDIAKNNASLLKEIKIIVASIFKEKEPQIRKDEMERFLYGAYESIDNVIAYLCSVELIRYTSNKDTLLRNTNKHYFITQKGLERFKDVNNYPALKWYQDRCSVIKKYFGNYTGEMLKQMQHNVEQYHDTQYSALIPDISGHVREKYLSLYNEELL